ncbi:MAG TPA: c-type cytochrome [Anaerolineales bacterium]|nr:c-type cytochrome [Anaerolineales bacterium]
MRSRENYTPFVATGFGLTLAILIVFQAYLWREPARIQAVEAADRLAAEAAGHKLYEENCVACHGPDGEGEVGPPLNSQELLKATSDETLFSLIRTGVPGTVMPAWGQTGGGPFTDEQLTQLVAFIRAWEPTAPEITPMANIADPVRGAAIFASTCFICHGENGRGADRAPALNDPARLKDFNDAWYRNTIAYGRPAKGMPTWGTVLSPAQINDLVALLAAWRQGQEVKALIPLERHLTSALFALRGFDSADVVYHLTAAQSQADNALAQDIQEVLNLLEARDWAGARARLIAILPKEEIGKALFETNCAPCHAAEGTGGLGPNLHANPFILSKSDEDLLAFILTGRKGTAMSGFEGVLTEEEVGYIITLLRTWQK